jgi:hypothetical protein
MESRFESLETLRKAAWESIATRRKYEWQISISFWGFLLSFIGAVIAGGIQIAGCTGLFLLAFPLVLCGAHCWWLCGLSRAYSIDKKDEGAFRKAMCAEIKFPPQDDVAANVRADVVKERDEKGALGNWNTGSQMLTTLALGYLAFYVIIAKSCGQ